MHAQHVQQGIDHRTGALAPLWRCNTCDDAWFYSQRTAYRHEAEHRRVTQGALHDALAARAKAAAVAEEGDDPRGGRQEAVGAHWRSRRGGVAAGAWLRPQLAGL